jgi:hypothetical protein
VANAHANAIAALADDAVEELSAAIARVVVRLRAYLAEELKDGVTVNAELAAKLEASLSGVLTELGYDQAVEQVLTSFEAVAERNEAHLADTLGVSFSSANREALGAFVSGTVDELLRYKGEAGAAVKEAVLVGVTSHAPREDLVAAVAHTAEVTLRQAVTEVDTSIMAFHREALQSEAEDAGFDLFEYVGPDDGLTRPFCQRHVDRIYTTGDLDDEDNGQGLEPTSRYLGGYNCRHSLAPVTVEEAQKRVDAESEHVLGGPEARRIVLRGGAGPNEADFVARNTGAVVERGGRQQVVRRRSRAG